MKSYISRIILGVFLLYSSFIFAQQLSQNQFKVRGNCEMCKERIETAAKKAGAKTAKYSIDSQTLTLETEPNVSASDILKEVAKAGHDNEKFHADEASYNALPSCCHYEREGIMQTAEEHKMHSKAENEFYVKNRY